MASKVLKLYRPELLRLLVSSCPVRRHGAWWHFKTQQEAENAKLSYPEIVNKWKAMGPEEKRAYFSMAKYDALRYKEQQSLWTARVCSLIERYGDQIQQLEEDLIKQSVASIKSRDQRSTQAINAIHRQQPNKDENNVEIKKLDLYRYKENYEKLIQCETTRNLYRNLFSEIDKLNQEQTTEITDDIVKRASLNHILSEVPHDQRAVLQKPRRPPTAYALFFLERREQYKHERNPSKERSGNVQNYDEDTYNHSIASKEWRQMSDEDKKVYYDRYRKEMENYKLSKLEFLEASKENHTESIIRRAQKERAHYSRSLRKKLRQLEPLSVRNAFNFYLMENKGNIRDLDYGGDNRKVMKQIAKRWRNMSEEEKAPYIKLQEEDRQRYERERQEWEEKKKELSEFLQ